MDHRFVLCALPLAIALALPGAHALAQETAAAEASSTEEVPVEITIANFAIEANAVEERLSRIDVTLVTRGISDEVTKKLAQIESEGVELGEQFQNLETRRVMTSEINALDTEFELLDARTQRQIALLSARAAGFEQLSSQNQIDIQVWSRAARSANQRNVPESVRIRTKSILDGLRKAQRELDRRMSHALGLQSRALDVRDAIGGALDQVKATQRSRAESVFQQQAPPLWARAPDPDPADTLEGYEIDFSWPTASRYLRGFGTAPAAAGLLLTLVLGWVFVRTKNTLAGRLEKRQEGVSIPWEDRSIEAMRHPWAAAALVALTSVRVFYPDRAVNMVILTWVIALPVWFVVVKEMVPDVLRKPLAGLGVLGVLHIFVTLVSGHPVVERVLLLVELALAAGGAAWTIHFAGTLELPRRVQRGFWFSATLGWTRLAFLMSLAGVVASVFGYTYFADEAALLVTIGSISATACIAIARIAEAFVATAIHAGRLDAFRMIRANRDVTSAMLSRGIRIAAIAFLVWGLSDMTSAWRPIGEVVKRGLETDLGLSLAETGVSFSAMLGFFFTLWLSWALSRFVSFVLSEEVLPRLHMQPGVPYALTTFTRYAIIAIGFIAAISVLGIPLDRLTIVLSALGVGIGFGLQSLVNNFVSGFVLLTERPIRLRDKVEIEGVLGNVSSIGMRASTIRTFDGAEVIVPNGDLISQRVVNWTLSARRQRVTIPVGVAYGTDPNEVLKILRRVAVENDGVFKDPAPLALFRGFGESSLDFELRIFMDPSDVLDVPSAVTIAINEALKDRGIEIPFPQRDLHLRGVPEGLALPGKDVSTDPSVD